MTIIVTVLVWGMMMMMMVNCNGEVVFNHPNLCVQCVAVLVLVVLLMMTKNCDVEMLTNPSLHVQ